MTKTFEIVANVTVECEQGSTLCTVLEAVDLVNKACAVLVSDYDHSGKVYHEAYTAIEPLMDASYYEDEYKQYADMIQGAYWALSNAEDEAYRKRYEGEFLKHFLNGVPSDEELADGCFSDWHKDIYGYRPRGERWNALVDIVRAYYRDRG